MNRKNAYYVLFSKSGFTEAVLNEVRSDDSILLVDLAELECILEAVLDEVHYIAAGVVYEDKELCCTVMTV